MGIRFFCPNGHKLNVKTEQAGKTGFCPQCGARVKIPFESTRLSSHHHSVEPAEIPAGDDGNEELSSSHIPPEPILTEPPVSEQPQETAVSPPPPAKEGMWYSQGADGQKYGPVDTQTIHNWVAERRIVPATLVWQEGWAEWREAKAVFQEFNGPPLIPLPPVSGEKPEPADEVSSLRHAVKEENQKDDSAAKRKLQRKKQKAFRDLIMIIALSAVILILAVVLLILVLRDDSPKETSLRIETSAPSFCLSSEQDQKFI